MKCFTLLICIATTIVSCQKITYQKKPVWSDEFDYSGAPDSTKWNYDLGDGCPNVCGWGNNEAQYYTTDSKNVRVENGNLIIEAHKDSLDGKAYTSTRIISKQKGDWLYGRI
ncbi:MAG: glycoside hydrolase family 16 protein, partial [Cytophagales bacterium]|nr:glycoside hydrolase family 16 protein [Cytophagales bacterium]